MYLLHRAHERVDTVPNGTGNPSTPTAKQFYCLDARNSKNIFELLKEPPAAVYLPAAKGSLIINFILLIHRSDAEFQEPVFHAVSS